MRTILFFFIAFISSTTKANNNNGLLDTLTNTTTRHNHMSKRQETLLTINGEDGLEVCNLVNEFRQENGLDTLQQSVSMALTAEVHYHNLVQNNHNFFNRTCNAHSWYPNATLGVEEFCCYPQESCMGDKGKLVTGLYRIQEP